ncbi:MAG: hypothetical protein DRJ62_04255 [Thermoprotei archaeon]|nr:MAG: hypothetical protein DRJ62_04255 [Thermoprotei archaeon]
MKVYAGHVVPIRGLDDKFYDVSEVTIEDVHAWEEVFLKYIRGWLEDCVKRTFGSSPSKDPSCPRLLADVISTMMKAPLMMEPIPGYLLSPSMVYAFWVLTRMWSDVSKELWSGGVEKAIKVLDHARPILLGRGQDLMHYRKLLLRVLEKIPADTRPGLNTSKLYVHLLLTSALAYCMGKSRGLDERKLQVLRLAALLHDVGKPLDWRNHVAKSVEVAKRILERLCDEQALKDILELIENHHTPDNLKGELRVLGNILRDADGYASQADRLVELASDVIAEALKKHLSSKVSDVKAYVKSMLTGSGRDVWDFWLNLSGEALQEATKAAVEKIRASSTVDIPGAEVSGVLTLLLDIRGIQGYIDKSEDLAMLSTRSYMVDLVTIYAIPRVLYEHYSVPPECVVYAGGGRVLALAPASECRTLTPESIKREVTGSAVGKAVESLGISLSKAVFNTNYSVMSIELESRLALAKRTITPREEPWKYLGFEKLCDVCSSAVATREEGASKLCDECLHLLRLSDELNFKVKWGELQPFGKTPNETWGFDWKCARQGIIELIAGQELEKRGDKCVPIGEMLNIAILSFDGNLMGYFMARTPSFAIAVEKNIRIDVSLKEAFRKALEVVHDVVKEVESQLGNGNADLEANKWASRCALGLLYIGGDDCQLAAPSCLAIPIAVIMCEEFYSNMGGAASLSCGIASAKAKYNIWSLRLASKALLEDSKDDMRDLMYKQMKGMLKAEEGLEGSLSLVFVDGGVLGREPAMTLLGDARSRGLSLQPYKANVRLMDYRSIARMLLLLAGSQQTTSLTQAYSEIAKLAYIVFKLSRDKDLRFHPQLKDKWEVAKRCRDTVRRIYHAVNKVTGWTPNNASRLVSTLVASSALAKLLSSNEKKDESLRFLREVFVDIIGNEQSSAPLYDIFLIVKFLGGGAL